jgi:hypothetical protein
MQRDAKGLVDTWKPIMTLTLFAKNNEPIETDEDYAAPKTKAQQT